MKQRTGRAAFTLPELLVIIVTVSILAVLAARMIVASERGAVRKAERIKCVSNLKQIALGFRIFATDNQDRSPAMFYSNQIALAEMDAATYWARLSNELSTPNILYCPADKHRELAQDFAKLSRTNISYFVSLNMDESSPQQLLAGDRNLSINGITATTGLVTITPNDQLAWTPQIHHGRGNVAMGDGSVQQLGALSQRFHSGTTNRLLFP